MRKNYSFFLKNRIDYYPFGMPMPNRNIQDANGYRYAYQGQEKDPETGKEAFQLRLWDGRIGRWLTTDPKGQYHSPYMAMGNNPISRVDPDGGSDYEYDNPVFGSNGEYRGNTIEGYTGQPIIYDGLENFETMTATQLTDSGGNYWQTDIGLTVDATAKIYNHILNNVNFSIASFHDVLSDKTYPKISGTFRLSSLNKKSILIDNNMTANFITTTKPSNLDFIKIRANSDLSYTSTIENIRSTVIIHEFYVHGKLKLGGRNFSHRIAYLATMYSSFWNDTTIDYKRHTSLSFSNYHYAEDFSNAIIINMKN